jgi:hypothetical protein
MHIDVAVVSNGIQGLSQAYATHPQGGYRSVRVQPGGLLSIGMPDVLVVPNGSDHVAMHRARSEVHAMLTQGGTLVVPDGWCTPWVPGNRWHHDNRHPTHAMRHRVQTDRYGLLDGLDMSGFDFLNGISGWWSCGYIEPAPGADVLLEDPWGRALVVLDEETTPGRMLLTASAPLAEAAQYLGPNHPVSTLWERVQAQFFRPASPQGRAMPSMAPSTDDRFPFHKAPNARIGLCFNGVWSHRIFAEANKYRDLYRLIYVHELTDAALEGLDALVIPFQSDHETLTAKAPILESFLARGRTIAVFGDASSWIGAHWEDRPVNNYWWTDPNARPPVECVVSDHPMYSQLAPRHGCWHHHGVYTRIPSNARVIQTTTEGETVTWEQEVHGGKLLVSTKDPIVEHGVQQIRHLDHYCDALTHWLSGIRPEGRFNVS